MGRRVKVSDEVEERIAGKDALDSWIRVYIQRWSIVLAFPTWQHERNGRNIAPAHNEVDGRVWKVHGSWLPRG